jgi:hypothetical protein
MHVVVRKWRDRVLEKEWAPTLVSLAVVPPGILLAVKKLTPVLDKMRKVRTMH